MSLGEFIIRDMLVFGIRDERAKERLLREAKLTLQTALDICRAAESSRPQVHASYGQESATD